MRISAKVDYGLRALCELAATPQQRIKADALAASQGIPVHFLENILRELRDAGYVESMRGSEGGYRLAAGAESVTLADVIRTLEGPLAAVRHVRPDELAFRGHAASLVEVWMAVRAQLRAVLDHVTVGDVATGSLPEAIAHMADRQDAP